MSGRLMLSRTQQVHLDGAGKPREVDFERLRESFLNVATKFFRAETDAERDLLRERVKDAGYGLTVEEIAALSAAARDRARGAGHGQSPMVAGPTTVRLP